MKIGNNCIINFIWLFVCLLIGKLVFIFSVNIVKSLSILFIVIVCNINVVISSTFDVSMQVAESTVLSVVTSIVLVCSYLLVKVARFDLLVWLTSVVIIVAAWSSVCTVVRFGVFACRDLLVTLVWFDQLVRLTSVVIILAVWSAVVLVCSDLLLDKVTRFVILSMVIPLVSSGSVFIKNKYIVPRI